MSQKMVLGIVGGHGWMGRSLGIALLERNILSADQLVVSSRSGASDAYCNWPDVRCVRDNRELAALTDVIVLSVRPQDLADIDIGDAGKGKLIISLLAMASVKQVAHQLGSDRVVRAMPNAAAEIRRAWFPWFAAEGVNPSERQLVQELLESCGMARELPAERDIDYLTALSGAGPAWPALLAKAMLEHAQTNGIPDDIALEAVMQTLVGGSQLLEHLGSDPGDMVERLINYDGTTAKGLSEMINGRLSDVVKHGLDAAHRAACSPRK